MWKIANNFQLFDSKNRKTRAIKGKGKMGINKTNR